MGLESQGMDVKLAEVSSPFFVSRSSVLKPRISHYWTWHPQFRFEGSYAVGLVKSRENGQDWCRQRLAVVEDDRPLLAVEVYSMECLLNSVRESV